MKDYRLLEAGLRQPDGVPVFKFEAELYEGEDFDGKFHIQFAAVERGGERRFAINSPRGLLAVFEAEASVDLASALEEHGEYILLVNYENTSWEEPIEGLYSTVILGRDVGKEFDWKERYELPDEDYAAIQEISRALAGTST